MSTSIDHYGATGTSYALEQAINSLTSTQSDLASETSTGMLSTSYAGLGASRSEALSLEPQITAITTWSSNVTLAQNTLTTTQTALSQITSIASALQTNLISLSSSIGATSLTSISDEAAAALSSLGTLLNTSSGSDYVFSGQDVTEPPVTDPGSLATSTLATSITSLVDNLDTSGASTVLQDATDYSLGTRSSSSLSVFSSDLSVDGTTATALQNTSVIGENSAVSVGMVATQGTTATATSTGSPIRDLIRNLMIVSSLGDADTSSSAYTDLISSLRSSTSDITQSLTDEEGTLGITQDTLTSRSTMLSTMSTMLNSQLDNVKSADLATVSAQTTAITDQLQASYTLIADMKGMTLANYL